MSAPNVGVHVSVELKVGDHVWKICDGDISAERGGRDNADKTGAGSEFEDAERAMVLTVG